MDNPTFRKSFPEFSDTAVYPDATLSFYSAIAEMQVSASTWGNMAPNGVMLYVAHEITLAARDAKSGGMGGAPGGTSGPINSKTVGSVTASYDTQQVAEKDAGFWNLTTYGKQFIRLSRLFGAGCVNL